MDDAVWSKVLEVLADPAALAAAAREHLGLLGDASRAEADALGEANVAVERAQRALAAGAARCIGMGLDEPTMARTLEQLQSQYQAAVRHRSMVQAMARETAAQEQRVSQVQQLAVIARERLVNADRVLQAHVFELLDVKVSVLAHARVGQPTQLRLEGSVAHDVLLMSAESDRTQVSPPVRAAAGR